MHRHLTMILADQADLSAARWPGMRRAPARSGGARIALLELEKEHTRRADELARMRRELP